MPHCSDRLKLVFKFSLISQEHSRQNREQQTKLQHHSDDDLEFILVHNRKRSVVYLLRFVRGVRTSQVRVHADVWHGGRVYAFSAYCF